MKTLKRVLCTMLQLQSVVDLAEVFDKGQLLEVWTRAFHLKLPHIVVDSFTVLFCAPQRSVV